MEKQKDEELKTKILNTYTKYQEESSSDRREVDLVRLTALAFDWCRDHLFYRERYQNEAITNLMGVEIVEGVRRCAVKNKTPEEFMEDLKSSLYSAKNSSYPNNAGGAIREPKIIKVINKIIATEEANVGRKLTYDERIYHIHRFIPKYREETIRGHLKGMDRIFINHVRNDEEDEDDVVESVESMEDHSLTTQGPVSDPQKEAQENSEAEIIMKTLETVLNQYKERMKPFYRALFTMHFLKKNRNYQKFIPVLNGEILEMFIKKEKIPTQYKIYMRYYPEAGKSTAGANATPKKDKFFADLEKAILTKLPVLEFYRI